MVDYNNYLVWQQLLHALPTGDLLHFPFVLESVNRCPPIRAPPAILDVRISSGNYSHILHVQWVRLSAVKILHGFHNHI